MLTLITVVLLLAGFCVFIENRNSHSERKCGSGCSDGEVNPSDVSSICPRTEHMEDENDDAVSDDDID